MSFSLHAGPYVNKVQEYGIVLLQHRMISFTELNCVIRALGQLETSFGHDSLYELKCIIDNAQELPKDTEYCNINPIRDLWKAVKSYIEERSRLSMSQGRSEQREDILRKMGVAEAAERWSRDSKNESSYKVRRQEMKERALERERAHSQPESVLSFEFDSDSGFDLQFGLDLSSES